MAAKSCIKEVGDLSVSALPSSNIIPNPAFASAESMAQDEIPTIDFSLLIGGTPNQRSQIIRDIGQACKEWGCFTLVNHGVPESLMTAMIKAFAGYFDLTDEEKEEYVMKQVFDPIKHGTPLKSTEKGESFLRDFLRIFVHPVFHSPAKPSNFSKISEEYSRQTREIAKQVSQAIYESLGLEESSIKNSIQLESFMQILIGNLYPSCLLPELDLGLPLHTDPFLLTVLLQAGTFTGLQVMHHDKWVGVEPRPNIFFVHVGDIFEIISNGMYKSLKHRVVLSKESMRMSVLSVIAPSIEALVSPLPELVERDGGSAAFRVFCYKEFIELRQRDRTGKQALDFMRL